jgi:hypothetical protein
MGLTVVEIETETGTSSGLVNLRKRGVNDSDESGKAVGFTQESVGIWSLDPL